MKKVSLLLTFVILMLPIRLVGAAAAPDRIYVSTTGSDVHNQGTKDSPFATIEKAKQHIRGLKLSAPNPNGYEVYIRGGVYELEDSLKFTQEDSGTEEATITYRAYGSERVEIIGGRRIRGSQFSPVEDEQLLDTLIDQSVRDKIVAFDLGSIGITDFGERYLRGAYSYTEAVSAGVVEKPSAPAIELFCNAGEMTLARYPNDGYIRVQAITQAGHNSDDTESPPYAASMVFSVDDARLSAWESLPPNQALMFGFWKFDWADQTIPIKSVSDGVITSQWSSSFGVIENAPFYVYDIFEEIDSPGEYYLDRSSGILYLYPPTENLSACEFTLSLLGKPLIKLNNTDYVRFKNLTITAARDKAIYALGSNNIFEGLDISDTASVAIDMIGENNIARDCYIHDTNGGIATWGCSISELRPGNNVIENNHIERFSRLNKTYTNALNLGGMGNIARYNEVHDAPHQAVSLGGVGQKLMYNEIHHVVNESDDAGAVYCGLSWRDRGHKIQYNYFHDIASTSGGGTGVSGVYADGGQCELYIEGNVAENIQGAAFKINGGQDNVIKNNIVVNSSYGLLLSDDMLRVDLTKRHIPEIEASDYIFDCTWLTAYPKLSRMIEDENNIRYPIGNLYTANLMYRSSAALLLRTAGRYIDISKNLVTSSNPGFQNEAESDWTLNENSVMYETFPNFKPIPFKHMQRLSKLSTVFGTDYVGFISGSPQCLINDAKAALEQAPYTLDGTVYLPFAFYGRHMGYTMHDMQTSITAAKTGAGTITVTPGSTTAMLDEESVALAKAPVVVGDTVMVGAEDMALLFGSRIVSPDGRIVVLTALQTDFSEYDGYMKHVFDYLSRTLEYKQ